MKYEAVIGLEVHVEINTASKVFCACKNDFHAPPNTHVCPICLGMPGVLPVLNKGFVEKAVMVGRALNCEISRWSKMDRKNYFYPDLAKNYQISQYDLPLCKNGYLEYELDGELKRVGITRAHLEEDTARNVHTIGTKESGVDFNRCGVSLLEIVTEPDIHSPQEAFAFLTALKQLLQYLDVSDCNMEEGSLRAEPNISIRPVGQKELGTKTEVKNVASFSGVQKAIEFELKRQAKLLDDGGKVVQETRGWDADKGATISQRKKESAHDYRYFPEPDLVPIVVDAAWENRIASNTPELPLPRFRRFQRDYELSSYDAGVLTSSRAMADYFEESVGAGAPAKLAANWIAGDLSKLLNDAKITISETRIRPRHLADMIKLIGDGTISGKIAKELLTEMFESGTEPAALVAERGLTQITDTDAIEAAVREVIAANPGPASDYRNGKQQAMGFLVGQTMKATKGKANPKLVNEILQKVLQTE